jgi:hypothetical protein
MSIVDYTPAGYAAGKTSEAVGEIAAARSDDLKAITDYIESQRAKSSEFPALLTEIAAFEKWLSGLSWYDKVIDSSKTLATAKWYRNKVNDMMGQALPTDWVSADAAKAAESAPTAPSILPSIPFPYKVGVGVLGVGLLALFTFSRVTPLRKLLP